VVQREIKAPKNIQKPKKSKKPKNEKNMQTSLHHASHHHYPEEFIKKCVADYAASTESLDKFADKKNVHRSTFRQWIVKSGLPIRNCAEG